MPTGTRKRKMFCFCFFCFIRYSSFRRLVEPQGPRSTMLRTRPTKGGPEALCRRTGPSIRKTPKEPLQSSKRKGGPIA
jgi:hypothetical protein